MTIDDGDNIGPQVDAFMRKQQDQHKQQDQAKTDQERLDAARQRYLDAAHAMQSGVAYQIANQDAFVAGVAPKSLRTGLNAAMSDQGGLAALLIAKGIFTEAEYVEAMADAMAREQARLEAELSEFYGKPITLA